MIGRRGELWSKLAAISDPQCTRCPLHKSTVHRCVMGRGSSTAKIVIIGEAPGEAESDTGLPFMGAAGDILNLLLEQNDMANLVYITNICKCRPPENRKPTSDERSMCGKLYLSKEMQLLKPKVIVLAGKTPTEYFLEKTAERGKVYSRIFVFGQLVDMIPTYHPAYYLHSGSKIALQQMSRALAKAKELAS